MLPFRAAPGPFCCFGDDDSPMFLLHNKAVSVVASVLGMLSKTWDGLPQPVL